MINTINEARTPGELVAWLRQWADGADASDHLDDNDARQLADAIERVCEPGDAAAMRGALLEVLGCYESGAIRTEYNDPDSWKHDDELCYLKDDVEAALAAPARNCDTVRDGREALGWCRESVAVERDAACDRGMRDAIRWLLAPAEKGAEK